MTMVGVAGEGEGGRTEGSVDVAGPGGSTTEGSVSIPCGGGVLLLNIMYSDFGNRAHI